MQTACLFNLSVRDSATGVIEVNANLTVKDSPRRIDKILPVESTLVQVAGALTSVPAANAAPVARKAIWTDANANTLATPGSGKDGGDLVLNDFVGPGLDVVNQGLYALADVDLFNSFCIPPYAGAGFADVDAELIGAAAAYCEKRRAFLIVDLPSHWTDVAQAKAGIGSFGALSANAALFFPRTVAPPAAERCSRHLRSVWSDRRHHRAHRCAARGLEGAGRPRGEAGWCFAAQPDRWGC